MNEPLMYLISCEKSRVKKSEKKSGKKSRKKWRKKLYKGEKKVDKNVGKDTLSREKIREKNLKTRKKIERKICMALTGLQENFLFLSFFLFLPWGFCFPRWVFDFAVSSCLFLLLLLPWDSLFLLWHFASLTPDPNDNFLKNFVF